MRCRAIGTNLRTTCANRRSQVVLEKPQFAEVRRLRRFFIEPATTTSAKRLAEKQIDGSANNGHMRHLPDGARPVVISAP